MKRRYHVLNDPADDEHLINVVEDQLDRLRRQGQPGYELHAVEGDHNLAAHVYLAEPGDPVLTVVRDATADTWYVMVEGEVDDRVDKVAEALVADLSVLDPAELRRIGEADHAGPRDLVRMALGAHGPADEDTVRILTSRLDSPDIDLRSAAAEAAALTQWPEFLDVLRTRAAVEPEPEVKRLAEGALATLRQALRPLGAEGDRGAR